MRDGIRLIAGLGNPDERHLQTRHNAGFWFADAVARKHGVEFSRKLAFKAEVTDFLHEGEKIWLLKPLTYMNKIGASLRAFTHYYDMPVKKMLVVHDEIDLPSGTARLKWAGGHGGHNGLRSAFAHLGPEFLRLRLGVGHPGCKDDVTGYVLEKPGSQEHAAINRAIDDAIAVLDDLLNGDTQAAMKRLHTGQ